MSLVELGCWFCIALVVYAYALYPLILAVLARFVPRRTRRDGARPRSVSIVLAVFNEEQVLARRLGELAELLAASEIDGEIIVVSDGSTDGSAAIAREFVWHAPVRVLEMAINRGKAVALTHGCAAARHEVIVFADARQTWTEQTLPRLLDNFADPTVSAVGGDLVLEKQPGVMAGVNLYWRYEKWLRKRESRVHSTVGVSGSISAVRQELFRSIPPGTLLDDVYWPLQVAMQGRRVVHESRAIALDRLPAQASDEFRRKVRTLSGNYQLLALLPEALLPWRNPIWFQFVSHKLLRLAVPWALLTLLVLTALLPTAGYRLLLAAQLGCYLLGVLGIRRARAGRSRLLGAAGSFLILNAAAWLAFWVWVSGRACSSWHKVAYELPRRRLEPAEETLSGECRTLFGVDEVRVMPVLQASTTGK